METKQMSKKPERREGSQAIAKAILDQYKPTTAKEMQEALRDVFGPMFEAMLQGEMESHLGYEKNDREAKGTANRRNGYTNKTVKSSLGDIAIRSRGVRIAILKLGALILTKMHSLKLH